MIYMIKIAYRQLLGILNIELWIAVNSEIIQENLSKFLMLPKNKVKFSLEKHQLIQLGKNNPKYRYSACARNLGNNSAEK